MTNSEEHFNHISKDYNYWKQKNHYYYQNLIDLYRYLIDKRKTVLEIGCGTGYIIASLDLEKGKGIDISLEMIEIAKRAFIHRDNLSFERLNILDSQQIFDYDYIILADVLEHVENLQVFLRQISLRLRSESKVIISVLNPIWGPPLILAEKLGMKMPEGPHKRYSVKKTEKMFLMAGLKVEERGYRLLFPKKIPGSDWINQRFFKNNLLKRFGFVVYWILEKV